MKRLAGITLGFFMVTTAACGGSDGESAEARTKNSALGAASTTLAPPPATTAVNATTTSPPTPTTALTMTPTSAPVTSAVAVVSTPPTAPATSVAPPTTQPPVVQPKSPGGADLRSPDGKVVGRVSTGQISIVTTTTVPASQCSTESVLSPDSRFIALILGGGCPHVVQAKLNLLANGTVLFPSVVVLPEDFHLMYEWQSQTNPFAKSLGYPNNMRKFSLREMLSFTGVEAVIDGRTRDRAETSRFRTPRLLTVKDNARSLCPAAEFSLGKSCLPSTADARHPNFPGALDPAKDLKTRSNCEPNCSSTWSQLFDRYWITDRGMIVTPTSTGMGYNFDPAATVRGRLKGVTGLRVTVEFEGGRVATIDVP